MEAQAVLELVTLPQPSRTLSSKVYVTTLALVIVLKINSQRALLQCWPERAKSQPIWHWPDGVFESNGCSLSGRGSESTELEGWDEETGMVVSDTAHSKLCNVCHLELILEGHCCFFWSQTEEYLWQDSRRWLFPCQPRFMCSPGWPQSHWQPRMPLGSWSSWCSLWMLRLSTCTATPGLYCSVVQTQDPTLARKALYPANWATFLSCFLTSCKVSRKCFSDTSADILDFSSIKIHN